MSRKKFIESQGATCDNWTWSWSFINKKDKIVIFGAWDKQTEGNTSLVLSEDWQRGDDGKKKSAYPQSREHIRLIEEDGYQLKTFPLIYSADNKDEEGIGPAKIKGFIPELSSKSLKKIGSAWYASDDVLGNMISEEVSHSDQYFEGASISISVNSYERNTQARTKCLDHHGYKCAVCLFDFEDFYGDIGKKFIHVHHIIPLSEIRKEYQLDPIMDLVPVCPNCHAIIHRTQPALTITQLKKHISHK